MSDFAGISAAKLPSTRNSYIQPGSHMIQVIAITTGVSNTTGKLYVAVDAEIITTTCPNEDHQPGSVVSVLMTQNISFLPNVKMLAKALLEAASNTKLRDEDINESTITAVLGERAPGQSRVVSDAAAGLMLQVTAVAATSKTGTNYTRYQYTSVKK